MIKYNLLISCLLSLSWLSASAQRYDAFLDAYHFNKNFEHTPAKPSDAYEGIQGNPYLRAEFIEGTIYLKDTTAVRLPLRLNLYTGEMEYLFQDVPYVVGDPELVNKIEVGGAVFVFLPFVGDGGYFELLASGHCFLVQKRSVRFFPAEGPKPIEAEASPARFEPDPDLFYLVREGGQATLVNTLRSVVKAMKDQQNSVETFIKKEDIKNVRKENLIRITEYYNQL